MAGIVPQQLLRQFSTTVLHGTLSSRINFFLMSKINADPHLRSKFVVASGEVGFTAAMRSYAGDVCVFPAAAATKETGDYLSPKRTPPPQLLIEVMSDSNLGVSGRDELGQKIVDSLNSGCKSVWVVYNDAAPFERNAVGVQQFTSADEVKFLKKPLMDPDTELEDGIGLSPRIKAKELLAPLF